MIPAMPHIAGLPQARHMMLDPSVCRIADNACGAHLVPAEVLKQTFSIHQEFEQSDPGILIN
jgi:hypothetical protein